MGEHLGLRQAFRAHAAIALCNSVGRPLPTARFRNAVSVVQERLKVCAVTQVNGFQHTDIIHITTQIASASRAGDLPKGELKMEGYRTYIAAAIAAVGGVIAMTDWVAFLSDWKAGATALGMAILMAVFRSITKSPPATPPEA